MQKTMRTTVNEGELLTTNLLSFLNPKPQVREVIFRGNERKIKSIGQTFSPQTFSKAADKEMKQKEIRGVCKHTIV